MARQFHDVLTSPGGWTCSCGAGGPGTAEDADDHVVTAWSMTVLSEDVLGEAS